MSFGVATLLVGGLGGLLVVPAVGALWWAARLSRRPTAEGVVVEVDRSSGEFPTVTFTPPDPSGATPSPVTFRSTYSAGTYAIGQKLRVTYDPNDPRSATLQTAAGAYLLAGAFTLPSIVTLAIALGFALWLDPAIAGRDAALDTFLAAARRKDLAALRASATPTAKLDEAFLLREVPASTTFAPGSTTLGLHDACVRGVLRPRQTTMTVALVETAGTWKVQRAGPTDPPCDTDLD